MMLDCVLYKFIVYTWWARKKRRKKGMQEKKKKIQELVTGVGIIGPKLFDPKRSVSFKLCEFIQSSSDVSILDVLVKLRSLTRSGQVPR